MTRYRSKAGTVHVEAPRRAYLRPPFELMPRETWCGVSAPLTDWPQTTDEPSCLSCIRLSGPFGNTSVQARSSALGWPLSDASCAHPPMPLALVREIRAFGWEPTW